MGLDMTQDFKSEMEELFHATKTTENLEQEEQQINESDKEEETITHYIDQMTLRKLEEKEKFEEAVKSN